MHIDKILGPDAIKMGIKYLNDLNSRAMEYLAAINRDRAYELSHIPMATIFSVHENTEYLWLLYMNSVLRKVIPEFYIFEEYESDGDDSDGYDDWVAM